MELKQGELFCGPGGLALGSRMAGSFTGKNGENWSIRTIWANDYDKNTVETYKLNNPCNPDHVYCENVADLPIGNRNFLGDIDILTFGFPCNDYSTVGKQKGLDGHFGPLYTYGVKALDAYKPMAFVAENVSGLSSANKSKALKKILEALQSAGDGYEIVPHLYKFEEYGLPQARHRIIIVGISRKYIREHNVHFKVPKPLITDPSHYKTSKEALENPPIPPYATNNDIPKMSEKVKKRLSYIPEGENAWYEGIPDELKLHVKGAKLSNIYKRLDRNKPAYTVTGSGGGGTHMYHWSDDRALTNRERARLQTFPDNFEFVGGINSVRKQVGMAVPPEGAKIIFQALLKTLAAINYDSVEPTAKLQICNTQN